MFSQKHIALNFSGPHRHPCKKDRHPFEAALHSHFAPLIITGVKYVEQPSGDCELLDVGVVQQHRTAILTNSTVIEERPQERESAENHDHHHDHTEPLEPVAKLVEVFSPRLEDAMAVMDSRCQHIVDESNLAPSAESAADEVIEIIISGDQTNRIDVVLMGDGYTADQRQRYEDDMVRLTQDMFEGETFSQYLPVFNIWGVFRASNEEGVGINSTPRDTAFGLYRQGTQLRGLLTSRANAAREACRATGPSGCDFPSLIGNDPYYGGLGGEFTISTESPTSGTVVLRHEMGHNFVNVGEEYDGGGVYRGVNWAASAATVGWRHWLTEPEVFPPVVQDSAILIQDYAWYDLARGRYVIDFTSNGQYDRWFLRFTTSGTETDDSMNIYLDGELLDWSSSGVLDRSFYSYYEETPWAAGEHKLEFEIGTLPGNGAPIRQLCSVTMHEYKSEDNGFVFDNNYVGAYRTWRQGGALAGVRPNNELCLMRNMSSPVFCMPCQEGMWMQFLNRMSLIDTVEAELRGGDTFQIRAVVVPLGQFRAPEDQIEGERYTSYWTQNGVRRVEFDNLFEFTVPASAASGNWELHMDFLSPSIRSDPTGLTHFMQMFQI